MDKNETDTDERLWDFLAEGKTVYVLSRVPLLKAACRGVGQVHLRGYI